MKKIAIIGIYCLFPDANNPQQFWQNLLNKKNSISPLTKANMLVNPAIYYDAEVGKKDRYYCDRGGYIKDFQFDPTGYKIEPKYLESLDDIFKWSLYVAKKALEDSGYLNKEFILKKCGVILGNLSIATKYSQQLISPIYRKTLNSAIANLFDKSSFKLPELPTKKNISPLNIYSSSYPSILISQAFSLGGINFAIDAACASALYSIKLACQYLNWGNVDLMLAGAVCCPDPFMSHTVFSLLRAYPETGQSKPLDKNSRGMLTGEGAGMLVLKRYEDAVRDRDKIYAVIRGVGLSNDGKGKYFVSPNPKGQILAFERAYREAGIDPGAIEYIECHATGTELGDKTELTSIDTFFGKYNNKPHLGSVKSNLGHLLTAAGMPSIIKVILGMSEGIIPATINVEDPLSSENPIITDNVSWNSQQKLAAINAFGFGGTNAHLILEEETGRLGDGETGRRGDKKAIEEECDRSKNNSLPSLGIVGMDVCFGGCDGLEEFDRTIYEGLQHFSELPQDRWLGIDKEKELLQEYGLKAGIAPIGAYLAEFELDLLKFKIPPKLTEQPTPQLSLMLKVADRALTDAKIKPGSNVAVIVAVETELASHQYRARSDSEWQLEAGLADSNINISPEDLNKLSDRVKESLHPSPEINSITSYIGNIVACRISSLWDFNGPAFTIAARQNSVFKAIEVAQIILAEDSNIDAVLLGAVDLCGGVENVLISNKIDPINRGKASLSFDRDVDGWLVGEGAGAVVLKSKIANGDRVYAKIDAVSLVSSETTKDNNPLAVSCRDAFAKANITASDIGYVEVCANGIAHLDDKEIEGLIEAYCDRTEKDLLSCAIGSVKANIGHTGVAAGMASLIKTSLCLYDGYIPATPKWEKPKNPQIWQNSPFYIPTFSRIWTLPKQVKKKYAAINGLGLDGTYAHLILSEVAQPQEANHTYLQKNPYKIYPLAGNSEEEILNQLDLLKTFITKTTSLEKTAYKNFIAFQNKSSQYSIAIVGSNKDELIKEIDRATLGVKNAFSKSIDWRTPNGSYFTAKPLGKTGDVAFVYPGSFNTYIGIGKDLYKLFPKTKYILDRYTSTPVVKELINFANSLYYPRSLSKLSQTELEILEGKLIDNASMMLVSGIIAAIVNTSILQDYFQVKPKVAFGNSLGELSAIFALNIWQDPEAIAKKMHTSDMFASQLSGPMNAVRSYWGLPLSEEKANKDFWSGYVLLTDAEIVKKAVSAREKVYITHINTPQEVIIAGDKQTCIAVAEELQCHYFPVPSSHVLHCQPMYSQYEEFVNWFDLPIANIPNIDLYSAANCNKISPDDGNLPQKLAKVLCEKVDFPKLVNQVYNNGTKIFIELGGTGLSCRWIREILKDKDNIAIPFNIKGTPDNKVIIRLIAQLLSHRVDLDLSILYPQTSTNNKQKSLVKKILLGKTSVRSQIEERSNFLEENLNYQSIEQPTIDRKFTTKETSKSKHKKDSTLSNEFFKNRKTELRSIGDAIAKEITISEKNLNSSPKIGKKHFDRLYPPITILETQKTALFDRQDLLEFARGKIEKVFGDEYAIVDTYPQRTRLPMPPYLFISRVTKIEGNLGIYSPASIVTEYDIPKNAWYAALGQVPSAIILEASHSNMFLISYLGIDRETKGTRVCRALGGTINFLDETPIAGDTIRCEVKITSAIRSGGTLIYFFTCNYFVRARKFLELKSAAGFFYEEQLNQSKGISLTKAEIEAKNNIVKQSFQPLLKCVKTSFDRRDLIALSGNKPDLAACFGENYRQKGKNILLGLPPLPILMLDRVTFLDPVGGSWGLGLLRAEKDLQVENWYFNCHFKDDFCLPGTLMTEGCIQLLQFYILYLGLNSLTKNARFQPIVNLAQTGKYGGQIVASNVTLTYELEVTEIGVSPTPFLKAQAKIIRGDRVIGLMKNLGIQLSEIN